MSKHVQIDKNGNIFYMFSIHVKLHDNIMLCLFQAYFMTLNFELSSRETMLQKLKPTVKYDKTKKKRENSS